MNIRIILVIGVLISLVFSCTSDFALSSLDQQLHEAIKRNSPSQELNYYIMPSSDDYEALPNQDPHNPITKEKAELGQLLFFETGLAQDALRAICLETYSCSTCHIPSKGFLPGRMQGIADGAFGYGDQGSTRNMVAGYEESELDAQGNRPLSVMNVTYVTNTLWGGVFGANDRNIGTEDAWHGLAEVNHTGYVGLEAQNIEGFDLHRLAINDKVLYDYGYSELFDKAFPDIPVEDRYSPETASFAMGSFLRTILTNDAPFQDYLSGDENAITESQKKGALLFFGKAGCATCHKSPSFSSMNFYALGTRDMYEIGGLNTSSEDPRILGRGGFTGEEDDMYRFKVPQLYNLHDYETFFHGSSKNSIEEVVEFKLAAKSENPNVSDEKVALVERSLTFEEKANLVDFLMNALYDRNMNRYLPDRVLSGNCFPNNDSQSRVDIGCN